MNSGRTALQLGVSLVANSHNSAFQLAANATFSYNFSLGRQRSFRKNVARPDFVTDGSMNNPRSIPLHSGRSSIVQGNLLDFPDDPVACMRRLQQQCGDLAVLEDNGQRLAFVFSPELNREVLSNTSTYHAQFFSLRGSRRSAQRRVTSGLLSMNGAEHRDSRRIMMDVFAKRILPAYHETICSLTDELLADWQDGQEHDLNVEMVHFMLRMTTALLFGIDDAEYAVELGGRIDRWVRQNHKVGMGAFVSSPEFGNLYDELLQMAEELEVSVQEMFDRHRAAGETDRRSDVLSLMFQAQQSEHQLSDEKLIGHATLTFGAAHLTTAHTFSWTLFLLAQHPDVMQRLTEELATCTSDPYPTFEELSSLPYLDWVIKESMRVLPASSYSTRVTAEATTLGPLSLPRGTAVIFSQYMTHHRPDLFERPDEFRPERWQSISPTPYQYLPFGAGPRMCIGAPLAMMELRTALAIILKRFHMQIPAGCTVNGKVVATMLGPTSSVPATLIGPDQIAETVPVYGSVHNLIDLPPAAIPASQRKAA